MSSSTCNKYCGDGGSTPTAARVFFTHNSASTRPYTHWNIRGPGTLEQQSAAVQYYTTECACGKCNEAALTPVTPAVAAAASVLMACVALVLLLLLVLLLP